MLASSETENVYSEVAGERYEPLLILTNQTCADIGEGPGLKTGGT